MDSRQFPLNAECNPLLRGKASDPVRCLSLVSAVRLTAAAGVVVVLLLVAVSAAERAFCAGCLVSYLLAAAYAGFAFSKWKRAGFSQPGRGLALALGSAATAFLLLLYPGLETPRASGEAGRRALAEVGGATPALPPLSKSEKSLRMVAVSSGCRWLTSLARTRRRGEGIVPRLPLRR